MRGNLLPRLRRAAVVVMGQAMLLPSAQAVNIAMSCKEVQVTNELWTAVAQYAFRDRPDVAFDGQPEKLAEIRRPQIQKFDSRFEIGQREPSYGLHEVIVTVLVEADGRVNGVAVHKGNRYFSDAVKGIAKTAVYVPAVLDGSSIPSIARLGCTFDVR